MSLIKVLEYGIRPQVYLIRTDYKRSAADMTLGDGLTIETSFSGAAVYVSHSTFVRDKNGHWNEEGFDRIATATIQLESLPAFASIELERLRSSDLVSFSDMVAFTRMWPWFVEIAEKGSWRYSASEVSL